MKHLFFIALTLSGTLLASRVYTPEELMQNPRQRAGAQEIVRILEKYEYALIRFSRTTCPACRKSEPYFKELANELPEYVLVMEINCSQSHLCSPFNIHSVPHHIFFRKGKIVARFGGGTHDLSKFLKDRVNQS